MHGVMMRPVLVVRLEFSELITAADNIFLRFNFAVFGAFAVCFCLETDFCVRKRTFAIVDNITNKKGNAQVCSFT